MLCPRRASHRHSHVVERLADHALRAGLPALLAENEAGALMIAAAPACIALLRQSEDAADQGLPRLRRHTVPLRNQVRSELTLPEQMCFTGALCAGCAAAPESETAARVGSRKREGRAQRVSSRRRFAPRTINWYCYLYRRCEQAR